MGLSVWCCDQAGPFQTIAYPGTCWQPEGKPACQAHEYIRNATAKILTLLHPADGQVRIEGVTCCPNPVLHGRLKQELRAIVDALPAATSASGWPDWQAGLTQKPTLPAMLPPLPMLLVLDNLAAHKTPEFVLWLFAHGIMPLYTPLGGSWLNLAESIQRILKRRALNRQHPSETEPIIAWFEAAARHCNRAPTPFVWGGKRALRRARQREKRHRLGGSGGYTCRPVRRRTDIIYTDVQHK